MNVVTIRFLSIDSEQKFQSCALWCDIKCKDLHRSTLAVRMSMCYVLFAVKCDSESG